MLECLDFRGLKFSARKGEAHQNGVEGGFCLIFFILRLGFYCRQNYCPKISGFGNTMHTMLSLVLLLDTPHLVGCLQQTQTTTDSL